MVIDIIQWIGALLGILGAPLVASAHSRNRRLGFAAWMGSNAALLTWGACTGAWALAGMQLFFGWSSWRGWRNNGERA